MKWSGVSRFCFCAVLSLISSVAVADFNSSDEESLRSYAEQVGAFSGGHLVEAVAIIDGVTFSRTANTVDGLVDIVRSFDSKTSADRQQWDAFQSTYTETSAADVLIRFRGVPIELSVDRNSNTLVFRLPSAGIERSFTGATRQESLDLLLDYLRGNQDDLISDLLREPTRITGNDPIAGNPTSLMAQMGAQDFADAAGYSSVRGGSVGAPALFGLGLDAETWKLGKADQHVYRLPLSYSFPLEGGYRLTISAPLFRGESEGVDSYGGSLGASLLMPVIQNVWTVTPAFRAGVGGSRDMGTVAALYSFSIASNYVWSLDDDVKIGMTNQYSLYKSHTVDAGDFELDYGLSNRALRNGLDVGGPLQDTFLGTGAHWRAWVIDTRFYGDELYSMNWQEYGVSVGTRVSSGQYFKEQMNLGLTYTHGENEVRGIKLNFGYKF